MGNIRYAVLQRIDHQHRITAESDPEFLYHLQTGLLLALREHGKLTDEVCANALSRLEQRHD